MFLICFYRCDYKSRISEVVLSFGHENNSMILIYSVET